MTNCHIFSNETYTCYKCFAEIELGDHTEAALQAAIGNTNVSLKQVHYSFERTACVQIAVVKYEQACAKCDAQGQVTAEFSNYRFDMDAQRQFKKFDPAFDANVNFVDNSVPACLSFVVFDENENDYLDRSNAN